MLSEKWRISLLNGLEITGNGTRVDRFRSRTSAELLALLVLLSHRLATREEIAGTIWPDSTPEAGRAGLRTALASLRARLEPPGTVSNSVLKADRIGIRLTSDAFTSDVLEYNEATVRAETARTPKVRLEAALTAAALYSGELLPGSYSEWVLAEREKLHQTFLQHLSCIVSAYRANDSSGLAIPYAQRLFNEDPCDEDACMQAMKVCIEAGRFGDALISFERLKRTLETEFDTTPCDMAADLADTARRLSAEDQHTLNVRSHAASTEPTEDDGVDADFGERKSEPASPPALHQSGLPIPLTRFFGRDTEIMHIMRMICPESTAGVKRPGPQRLITITGAGGTGKTRLATELGASISERHHVPITFVPLADISDPARIPDAIARALNISATGPTHLFERIVSAFTSGPHLLILDNLEQLLGSGPDSGSVQAGSGRSVEEYGAAELLAALLQLAPALQCVVTSRQSLGIDGEQEYPLQPLGTPGLPATPERLLDFASVKLFVDRAQLSRPEFQLTPRNADQVGSICARLDGLPLALELAAAWSSILSPAQILERIGQRFELLIGRKRGRAARHASLRAALEWSFDLLSVDQQQFFSCLSVFRGGWVIEAAEQVCDCRYALETLTALRDRSLIVMEESAEDADEYLRYRLLESLREYASEQLSEADGEAARRRHLQWYAARTAAANASWGGTDQQIWLQRVQFDQENIRTALEFSLRDSSIASAALGLQIMANLSYYWNLRGNYTEVRELFSRFLVHPGAQQRDKWRARALIAAGSLAVFQQDWKAATPLYEESLAISRECVPAGVATAQIKLGHVALEAGDLKSAKRYFQQSLTSYESSSQPAGVAAAYGALGEIAVTEANYPAAIEYVQKAVEINRRQKDLSGVTHHVCQLGEIYLCAGHRGNAQDCLVESLKGYYELKDVRGLAELFVMIAENCEITTNSAALLGAANTINQEVSAHPKARMEVFARCRELLGDEAFEASYNMGQQLTTENAVELAGKVISTVANVHNMNLPKR